MGDRYKDIFQPQIFEDLNINQDEENKKIQDLLNDKNNED